MNTIRPLPLSGLGKPIPGLDVRFTAADMRACSQLAMALGGQYANLKEATGRSRCSIAEEILDLTRSIIVFHDKHGLGLVCDGELLAYITDYARAALVTDAD